MLSWRHGSKPNSPIVLRRLRFDRRDRRKHVPLVGLLAKPDDVGWAAAFPIVGCSVLHQRRHVGGPWGRRAARAYLGVNDAIE